MTKSNTITGAVAGDITLRLFRALPLDVTAWAAKAWAVYATTGEEPEEVPEECLAAWVAIKGETDNMKAAREAAVECGKRGGRPRKNAAGVSETENPPSINETPLSNSKPPFQKSAEGFQNENQKNLEEKRREEKYNSNTSEERIVGGNGAGACAPEAGSTPPPPHPLPPIDKSIPAELIAAMSNAPLTAEEAFATGTASGLSEAQILDWAHYNATREWTVGIGANVVPMNKRKAIASLGSWASKERSFGAERRLRGGGGTGGGDNATIRGVRVANKGDDLGDWGK